MINVEVDPLPQGGPLPEGLRLHLWGGQLDLEHSWSRGSIHFWRKASSFSRCCTTGSSYLSHQWPKSPLHTFGPEELIQPTLKSAHLDPSRQSHHALRNAALQSFVKYLGTIMSQLTINKVLANLLRNDQSENILR